MSGTTDLPAPDRDDTLAVGFRQHTARLNVTGLRTAAVLSAILFPLFMVVDHFVIPDYAGLLAVIRIGCSLFALALTLFSYHRKAVELVTLLTVSITLVDGFSLAFMVHLHDLQTQAGPSPYYGGLNLVFIASGLLFSWTKRVSFPTFATIFLAFVVPSIAMGNVTDTTLFVVAIFFLGSTMTIVAVAQALRFGLQKREYEAKYEVTQAHEQVSQANERLKEMDRYKSDFFSNITHELKTPLTLILAPVESILKGELGEFGDDQRTYLLGVHRNSLRLLKLINDLLDLSKLEDSRLRLRIEQTDLAQFLSVMVDSVLPLALRKSLTLTLECGDDDLEVWVDRHRFERVALNLLANATKFTPVGGTVEVRAWRQGDRVRISVEDSGIGIPADKLDFVFDRFSQVDSSGTRKYGGTGIGLALAKELVSLHGGRIWAESEEGAWTRMNVELRVGSEHFAPGALDRRRQSLDVPRGQRVEDQGMAEWAVQLEQSAEYKQLDLDMATDRRLVPRRRARSIRTHKVLVVEDNREMLQLIHTQLQDRFDVLVADDGQRGWDMVENAMPDLVVTDRMMPVMDGVELTARIKEGEATRHIPVVMLTARSGLDDRVTGREAGADEYLAKPFSPRELIAVIEGLLKSGERHTETVVDRELDATALLSGRLAHEMKNPMNLIKNGSELFQRSFDELLAIQRGEVELSEDEQQVRLAKLQTRVQRMGTVIADGVARTMELLEVLREYTREGYTRQLQPYSLDGAVRKAVSMVDVPDGVQLECALGSEVELPCVPEELHEVVFNLVKNAVEATDGQGHVRVSTQVRGGHVRLEVADDGPGIPAQARSRVFAPFYSSKEGVGGMGLGLPIVRQLVRSMGGEITIEGEVGEGARFVVVFPLPGGNSPVPSGPHRGV